MITKRTETDQIVEKKKKKSTKIMHSRLVGKDQQILKNVKAQEIVETKQKKNKTKGSNQHLVDLYFNFC